MRNQVFKKLFSVLLALIMVAGLLPASVLAEGEGNADSTPAPTEAVQPTESAEPTAPTETETPEVTEAPEPTPENPAATVEPTQGEPTAEPTDEGIMPANVMPVQANVAARDTSRDDYYRIVHLDCGREYFSKDWIIALINEMAAADYNQLQLAFGNGGFRFYLDDMSVDTYSSEAVKSALEYGNKQYNTYGDNGKKDSEWIEYNPTTNALTEPEMDAIIAYAKTKSIEIVPMLNTPGHMNALLHAMSKLEIGEYNDLIVSSGCMNLRIDKAVDFTGKLVEKYIKYFKEKDVVFFHLAMDEYHDASGNTSFTSEFFTYANRLIDNVIYAGMTPRVFNDALTSSNNRNSFTAGTQVCCWNSANVSGYSLINTSHDFYYVSTNEAWNLNHSIFNGEGYTFVGDYVEDTWITHAKKFNNNTFLYKKVSSNINPVGSMFCIWCNTPGKNDETQIAQQIRMILRVIGARMKGETSYNPSDVLVEGGFKADGTINVPTNNTTVGNGSGNTTADNDTVRVTGPNLAALTAPEHTGEIADIKAVDGRIKAYDVTPSTADNNKYTGEAEVRIKIPAEWDSSKVIALIVESDGTVEDINGTATEDGWYVFTAPHFSVMGIYEKAATTEVGGTIEIVAGQTGVITVPGDVTNNVGEIENDTVATKVKVEKVQQHGETISYSATASASIKAYQQYYYNASNLIDGRDDTYYWSNDVQTVDAYAQVDLGAAIPFDAVRIIPTNHDDAACTADVKVSADGSTWTKIGSYDGTKTTILNNTVGNVRYIRVEITVAKTNWWQLAEIQWGSYANGTFTRMAASGSVTTEGKTETQVTIKGIAGGETTIEIDGKTYTIKVVDATLAQQVLPINLWITNTGVVPTGWGTSFDSVTREGFTYALDTAHTSGGWETFRAIYELKATEGSINSEQGAKLSELIPNTGKAYGYRGSDTPEEYNVDIWKCSYNASAERQSTDGWTNSSNKGTEFEYIRYWENKWEYYSATNGQWIEITNVGAGKDDSDKNQVCVWYRQVTTVTSEVTTEIVDWGPIEYGANQCLLDFAVKYDGTANRIPNSFPVTGKTIGFDCPTDQTVPLGNGYVVKDTDGTYYRTVYGIAGVETAEYEVYMITLTPSSDSHNVYINKGSTQTSYTYGGTEKIAWAKTEADANSTELNKMPNVKYGGEPFLESVKIYQYQGLLVTYYLRAKQTPDSLTVHYAIQGSETAFYEYNIAVNQGTTFNSGIALDHSQDPYVGGPLLNGTVINSNGETITVSSNLATLQGLEPQYRYSKYKVEGSELKDTKNVWIYYTFTREHTYVIDFGLPLKIKFSDFGVTNDAAIETVSLWKEETVLENKGLYGTAKVITDGTEGKYVLYTLDKPLDKNITIPLYVKFQQRGDNDNNKPQLFTANIIPATNVYYEDSFAKFTDGSGTAKDAKWTIVNNDGGKLDEQQQKDSYTNQALEALGNKTNVYGYDPAYNNCTKFSMGSARKVTVTSDMATNWNNATSAWPTAQFTFKGTGFDIISLTDNTSGAIFVDVTGKSTNKTKTYVVNNYYGYKYDEATNTWEADTTGGNNALYQIPVIAVRGLDYDEYNVVITVAYNTLFDKTKNSEYSFWLDAVRVYDPMGKSVDTGETYKQDGEAYPQYIKLRNELAKEDGSVTVDSAKLLFIDGAENAAISLYKNYGPNNEVYLATGQAITFKLNVGNAQIETVQIGAKAPMSEGTAKLNVNGTGGVEKELSTATEMYYDITDAAKNGNAITITNKGNAILSLTNLKITFNAQGSVSLGAMNETEQAASVMAVRALFAPAPVEPEPEPEPEKTFEPERFEASWSRNVMQGRKATLTVKTSEDVEAITVDGQTIRSYRTRTERVGFGRRAKRITYREFTYSMVAQESADFSVTAINAEGTESEAITARLTVKTRPNSLRDMWDWFKGWF